MSDRIERNRKIDALKGILIILVVAGHFKRDTIHDTIFLFHMPLFFILSGCLYKHAKFDWLYIKKNINRILIPYFSYMLLNIFILDRNSSSIIRYIWGGRSIPGVYWYMTCLMGSLLFFTYLINSFKPRTVKLIIFMSGCVAVIESNLLKYIHVLQSPGIPWNLDVCLIAIVYIAIGFYCKTHILQLLNSSKKNSDLLAVIVLMAMIAFCLLINKTGWYYFDMRPVYYKELFLALSIPVCFGVILARLVYWIEKCVPLVLSVLSYLGKFTIPIMFIHISINTILSRYFSYGRLTYIIIGIIIPCAFAFIVKRYKLTARMFGVSI